MSFLKIRLSLMDRMARKLLRPKIWLQNTWRFLMHDPSIPLFVWLTLVSLMFGGMGIWQASFSAEYAQLSDVIVQRFFAALLIPLVLALPISILLVKRKITPQEYATLVASKRSPAETLNVVVIEAERLVKGFWLTNWRLNRYFNELGDDKYENQKDLIESHESGVLYNRSIRAERSLINLWSRQCGQLRRLEALKLFLADDIGISPRRLCDSLVGFSPAMYSHHVRKLITYITQLRSLFESRAALENNDWHEIKEKCEIRIGWIKASRDAQKENREHFDLLAGVCKLSSGYSTSAALVSYASLVHRIANESKTPLNKLNERWRYIYLKHKARPGFDLHSLLMTAVMESDKDIEEASLYRALKRIHDNEACDVDDLSHLQTLPVKFRKAQRSGQESVNSKLREYVNSIDKPEDDIYFAVYGYSETVVSALQANFPIPKGNLLLLTNSDDAWNVFETRMLKLVFADENPAIVDIHSLGAFICRNAHVLILIGAEAYSLQVGVIHPRGMQSESVLKEIRLQAPRAKFELICLAETYKKQDLEGASKLRDLDHLTIYPKRTKVIKWILPEEIHKACPSNSNGGAQQNI